MLAGELASHPRCPFARTITRLYFADWIMFAVRALLLATVFAPVALGEDRSPGTLPSPLLLRTAPRQIVDAVQDDDEPTDSAAVLPALVPPAPLPTPIEPVPTAAAPPAQPAAVAANTYWIVSSRCSVQDVCSPGPWGLNVYQRVGDCPLIPTDVPSLSSQIVPGVPVLIYVHGSFVEWESQCREAHEAHRVLSSICQPLQMIFYTWPSTGPHRCLFPLDAAMLGERAEFNGFHLAWLVSQIPDSCPICFLGHSHGSRTVLSAMQLAAGGTIQGHVFTGYMGARRYRAVLAAAALDHNWLNPGERYGCALNLLECLLNLKNRHDLALAFYPLNRPFAHRALARSGFTRRDAARIGWNMAKITEVDVTPLLGPRHLWPYYYADPAIDSLIRSYMQFGR